MQPNANPYDYILNPPQAPKKLPFLGSGKPNKLVMVAFVLFVLLLVFIAISVFNSVSSKSYASVVDLAERQTEIVRIADLGLANAQDPATIVYVSTIRNTTLTEKIATTAFLKKKKTTVTAKQLVLKKDTTTDKALTTAKQNNTYDQVLVDTLNGLLVSYQRAEKNVTGTQDSASEKALFATLLSNAKTLAINQN